MLVPREPKFLISAMLRILKMIDPRLKKKEGLTYQELQKLKVEFLMNFFERDSLYQFLYDQYEKKGDRP